MHSEFEGSGTYNKDKLIVLIDQRLHKIQNLVTNNMAEHYKEIVVEDMAHIRDYLGKFDAP
jgi:tetrahydromethanopterin S-methyltransferase subunit B